MIEIDEEEEEATLQLVGPNDCKILTDLTAAAGDSLALAL